MGNKKRMGRNPLGNVNSKRNETSKDSSLFKEVIKPMSGVMKIKEMKVQVDLKEFYNCVVNDIKKVFFILPVLIVAAGCANTRTSSNDFSEMKRQLAEIQKNQGRQASQIDELNNKILLLADRMESREGTQKVAVAKPVPPVLKQAKGEVLKGDSKIYEMAMRDLKNQSFDQFEKRVDLLAKGYKESPLTNNAIYLMGESQFKRGQYGKAAQTFEKLYSVSPDGNRAVSALYFLGNSYEKLGRIQEAKEAFQSIISIYPGSREAAQSAKKIASLNRGP